VIDEANTAQARELLQSLHAHVDEISKRVESAEGRTRRVQGHAAVVAGAGWPAFVTSSMKRTDSSTGCIDASRTRDPGEWPGRGLNFRAECAVRVSKPGPAD